MVKVLLTWHSAVVASYQRMAEELAKYDDLDLTLLIPPRWTEGGRLVSAEKKFDPRYKIIVGPTMHTDNLDVFFYWLAPYYLLKLKPDIIHLIEEPWSSCAAHFLFFRDLFRLPAKIIFSTFQNINYAYSGPLAKTEAKVFAGASRAVAFSEEIRNVLLARNFKEPISVIPLGVDQNLYKKMDVQNDKKKLGLENFTIGYIGRLAQEKGLETLLHSVVRLEQPFKLLLVGNGPYKDQLLALANQLQISQKIVWINALSNDQIPRYINLMDVLVLPSLTTPTWKEQFGRVLVEAMLCEVPVIGSSSGEIPHVIKEAGMIFKEGNVEELLAAIKNIMQNPALRPSLIGKGKQRALENYTWQRIAEKTHSLYQETALENKGPIQPLVGAIQSILVIKLDRIGDILLTLPSFKAIRTAFPQAKITVLISPLVEDLIKLLPYFDEIITYEFFNAARRKVCTLLNPHEKKEVQALLGHRFFDAVINLRPFEDTREFQALCHARYKIGMRTSNKNQHVLKQIGAICREAIGKEINEKDFTLTPFIPAALRQKAQQLLAENGISPDDPLVGIHTAAGTPSKLWSDQKFAQLADLLISRLGCKVFFIGDAKSPAIRYMQNQTADFAGSSLPQSAALIEKAKLFISTNSGPMHLAAAVQTKTLGLFSGESLPLEWGPWGAGHRTLSTNFSCAPCHLYRCNKKRNCMESLAVETVFDAAHSMLCEK